MADWTLDEVDRLKLLIEQGLSGGHVAAHMAKTRNQVIGKAKRLGLQLRGKPFPPPKAISAAARPRKPNKTIDIGPLPAPVVAPTPIVPIPEDPSSAVDPVHILDVRGHHCRAVLSARGADGLAMFCGAPKIEVSSYCAFHSARFIQPPKETIHGKASYRE